MFIVKNLFLILLFSLILSLEFSWATTIKSQFEKIDREDEILLSLLIEEKRVILKRVKEAEAIALKKARQKLIFAKIDLSTQSMKVFNGDEMIYDWKVSTARRGYRTPIGNYKPLYLVKMHYSRQYNNSPMPYSIFFNGGYAIHGTSSVRNLGKKASHGCVRLHPKNAQKLYKLVLKYGKANTTIEIKK